MKRPFSLGELRVQWNTDGLAKWGLPGSQPTGQTMTSLWAGDRELQPTPPPVLWLPGRWFSPAAAECRILSKPSENATGSLFLARFGSSSPIGTVWIVARTLGNFQSSEKVGSDHFFLSVFSLYGLACPPPLALRQPDTPGQTQGGVGRVPTLLPLQAPSPLLLPLGRRGWNGWVTSPGPPRPPTPLSDLLPPSRSAHKSPCQTTWMPGL